MKNISKLIKPKIISIHLIGIRMILLYNYKISNVNYGFAQTNKQSTFSSTIQNSINNYVTLRATLLFERPMTSKQSLNFIHFQISQFFSIKQQKIYFLQVQLQKQIYKLLEMLTQPSQTEQQQVHAYNVFQNQKMSHFFLKSPYKLLNNFLQGGLHTGMITQIFGQSGGGKTQMAMLFSISFKAINENRIVGYLATEKQLHWGRFTQLAYNIMNEAEFDQKEKNFVYKKSMDDYDAHMNFIQHVFKEIQKSKKGGLLVIDNIYSLINSSFAYFKIQSAYQKTRKQAQIVNKIRKMAKTSNSCILLINKVSDVIQKKRKSLGGRQTAPSLGASWQLNVDQSFELKKGERSDIKQLITVHSPKCKEGKILFRIQENGYVFVGEDGVQSQI